MYSRKSVLILLALAVLAVALAGCSSPTAVPSATPGASGTPTVTPSATLTASGTPTAAPAPSQASVQIKDFAFNPQDVRVAKGGTVTWSNMDSTTHTISFAGVQSPGFGPGQTFAKTFNEAGTFDYICGIHTYMHGRVIVE